jgi:hypothetical protein
VAARLPAEGLDLMWRFLELANGIFGRCDDSSGTVANIFHAAVADLAAIADSARPDPKQLADQVFSSLLQNDYGQFDGLIQALQPALRM